MEAIRRKFSIDDSRCHTQGILPYIKYGVDDSSIHFVDENDVDGNWGEYVCDFAKVLTSVVGGDVTYYDTEIISRLRYCDLMLRYSREQDIIYGSPCVKLVIRKETEIQSVDCEVVSEDCVDNNIVSSVTYSAMTFVTNFKETVSKYDFVPVDARFFSLGGDGVYRYVQAYGEEDEETARRRQEVETYLSEYQFFRLINNYDMYLAYESFWFNWWNDNFGSGWTVWIDEEYEEKPFYGFVIDFEKYCLGRVYVPEEFEYDGSGYTITGLKVPEYVYYSDIKDYLDWFESHDIEDKDIHLQKEWDDHGGDEFRLFLTTIVPKWILDNTEYTGNGEPEERMCFISPIIESEIYLSTDVCENWTYDSYLVDYQPFSATGIFSGYSGYITTIEDNDYITGNNTNYVELTDSGMVESQLDQVMRSDVVDVDGMKGCWCEFDTSEGKSNMLKCVYYSGLSQVTGVDVIVKDYYEDGTYTTSKPMVVYEICPSTRNDKTERVLLLGKKRRYIKSESAATENPEQDIKVRVTTSAYTQYEYQWVECWRMDEDSVSAITCADGEENVNPNDKKYRTISILETAKPYFSGCGVGDTYYFLTKYDNGRIFNGKGKLIIPNNEPTYENCVYFDMPYHVADAETGEYVYNLEKYHESHIIVSGYPSVDIYYYSCDYIDNITEDSSGMLKLDYIIGGVMWKSVSSEHGEVIATEYGFLSGHGIHFSETLPYTGCEMTYITIDGMEDVPFYCNILDVDFGRSLVYSDDFRKYRYARKANLIGYEVASIWNKDEAIIAKLITRDGSETLQDDTRKVIDISFDRGNAAAFENYYKLAECKTFTDLKNYGNNQFNIN